MKHYLRTTTNKNNEAHDHTVNGIGDEGATMVIGAIKRNTTLTKLCLKGIWVFYPSTISVEYEWRNDHTVNGIGDLSIKMLCEMLKENTTLTCLNLDGKIHCAYLKLNKGFIDVNVFERQPHN